MRYDVIPFGYEHTMPTLVQYWYLVEIEIKRFYLFWKHHKLLSFLAAQCKLKPSSLHGRKHWMRVGRVGAYLCRHIRADYEVVFLFAYLHDIERMSEHSDPEHGERAAALIEKLYNEKRVKISQNQLELLAFASRHHTDSDVKSDDITIQTCWDSDRLDLWRAGMIPNPSLLNTEFGRTEDAINYLK